MIEFFYLLISVGIDVHVQCKFKAISPRTTEQISFSVNRTTIKYGTYKVDIPSIDGVHCTEDPSVQSFFQASLITTSVSDPCNVPNTRSTSNEITVKSKQNNDCTYTLGALSYKLPRRNVTICGNARLELESSWNPSKNFLPCIPPYVLPQLPPLTQFPPLMPQYPLLPRLSPLPPFPSFPFPPLKPNPPSLPYPFPPPAFNLGDPATWMPNYPSLSPLPPLPPTLFNFWDPNSQIPRSYIYAFNVDTKFPPISPNPTTQHP